MPACACCLLFLSTCHMCNTADILNAVVSTDRQGDAFKNMNNLHQGRQSLSAYHLKVNKALREYDDAFAALTMSSKRYSSIDMA